jgi:flagellar protein FliS
MSNPRTEAILSSYRSAGLTGVVQDASPHRLIHLLLDGALTRLAAARSAMDAADAAQKGSMIGSAMSIVSALRGCLDVGTGGQLAGNLEALYDYMNRRLLDASARNQREAVDEVIGLMRELAQAWEAMPATAKAA